MPADDRCCALAAWGSAWLAGLVPLDDVLTEVQGDDLIHVVADRRAEPDDTEPLALGLGRLRRAGARGLRVLLPAAGDVGSLPGPPAFNTQALAAGAAVLVVGAEPPLALLPEVTEHGSDLDGTVAAVRWQLVPVAREPAPPEPVRAADLALTTAVRETTAALLDLDVAGARAEVAAALRQPERDEPRELLPVGYPPEAHALLARVDRLSHLLALADRDTGAAVSASEVRARAQALRPLAAAVRHAREAVYASLRAGGGQRLPSHGADRLERRPRT